MDAKGALHEAAARLIAAGLSIVPAIKAEKRPIGSWKRHQERPMSLDEASQSIGAGGCDALAIIAGGVSGNVEMLDFDLAGESFAAWATIVRKADPSLLASLAIEATPSGGRHVVYKCASLPPGNARLAMRQLETNGPEPVRIAGKPYKPRQHPGGWRIEVVLIETRGEGGLFLCAPTDGYVMQQGDLASLPTLNDEQRDILVGAAMSLNEVAVQIEDGRPIGLTDPSAFGDRPGDLFNQTGDSREVLLRHGWRSLGRKGDNEHWVRPGKDEDTTSATLRDGVFFVFSSNAVPFEAGRGYSPFAVLTLLDHDGDYAAAAATLIEQGFLKGGDGDVDLSGIMAQANRQGNDKAAKERSAISVPLSYRELIETFPSLRTPVVHGLLREGESMNVIAAPKTGKSWLAMDLAIAVATGDMWLDRFRCEKGKVLIIDNELHAETTASRLPRVAEAKRVPASALNDMLYIDNLRGRLLDIDRLRPYFDSISRGRFKLVILDAFYRFMPAHSDENDNSAMARVYNTIDAYADHLGACFVLIHHTSKGVQSGKSVTDVGAGAGAQSRATDCHFVLRQHSEEGVVVLDAAVRSFKPIEPVCLRFDFPLWSPDYSLDPAELRPDKGKRKEDGGDKGKEQWDAARFARTFVASRPKPGRQVIASAIAAGVSERQAKLLLAQAEEKGMVFRWKSPRHSFASFPEGGTT